MADEPPPLFPEDEKIETQEESDDIFQEVQEEATQEEKGSDEHEDLFAGVGEEVSLDDTPAEQEPEPEPEPQPEPQLEPSNIAPEAIHPPTAVSVSPVAAIKTKDEIKEEEGGDKYEIEITVTDPQKKGEGMKAYMAYKVATRTSMALFKKPEFYVWRRFSDFLGLHEKLVQKHAHQGHIVPPAPEKSLVGMTQVKVSKDESGNTEFVERRRASLERYLNRTAAHKLLRQDPDFRDFLERDELPRATGTSAVSGAGVMRLFNKVSDTVSKITSKMNESDQWFEDKSQQIDSLDQQLKKLHSSVEALVNHRKDLSTATATFAKSAATLGNAEEHTGLSRALAQLAEVEEKIEQLHQDQANTDFFVLSELLKDYIGLIGAIREVFREREKAFHTWQNAQTTLSKKQEQEVKLQASGKQDKVAQIQDEIKDWERKVDNGQEDFERVSKTIRKEIEAFETQRVQDFRSVIVKYLETLMDSQQQLIKYWEGFLPEAKAIA
ncbi:sorting nexin 2 [Saccoglossus kowalevskii]|uniref:Sorting nexin 2 n=1 Tax=Saccoglossus kowalevskii TaxID=10224 RepID=A0ABM0GGZ5_SACKO|nr:sorting nexin 2 [Saccoglossus kowalevskii]